MAGSAATAALFSFRAGRLRGPRDRFAPRRGRWLLLCLAFFTAWATAADAPRIGLVLSGGGARGAAHIGVIKVLEEMRIPIHAIAGTSMGSLVGGAYASGLAPAEMERRIVSMDWNDLFDDDPPRTEWPARRKQEARRPTWDFSIGRRDGELRLPKGAISGQKVQLFFADLVQAAEGARTYDDLPIPFRAVATDLETGRIKVFDRGSMPAALRASMSVPGLFAPMEWEGGLYVDGGLVRNLPVDIVRTMGVDVVIAVNLGSSYLARDELGTIVGVAEQMIAILTEQNVERSLAELEPERDLLIAPDLGDIGSGDFDRAPEAIAAGEAAARSMAGRLARFGLDEAGYRRWQQARLARVPNRTVTVETIQVSDLEFVNPALFDGFEARHAGKLLDRDALEADLQGLYGRGDFERLSYRIERTAGGNLLIVDAVEKSWGPGYLNFGIGLASDGKGDNRFGIRGTYRQSWINELGADWTSELTLGNEPSLFSEFYQPLRLDRAGFVAPYLDVRNVPMHIYIADDRVARYLVSSYQLGADLGTTLGSNTEFRLGALLARARYEVDTGDPRLPEESLNESGLRGTFIYDTLDSGYIPRRGMRLAVSYDRPLQDMEYNRLYGNWTGALSQGENSLVAQLGAGSSFGDPMPYHRRFPLGGFLKVSGYANEQFRGDRMVYAGLVYYRRVASLTPPLGRGLYLGGSLEYGRLWDDPFSEDKDRYGASLFFGADSWVGPLYLGVGLSGEGDSAFYVLLGQP